MMAMPIPGRVLEILALAGLHKLPFINKKKSGLVEFCGDYSTWDLAMLECNTMGYADKQILDKTLHAALSVKSGRAVFERDSVLFDKVHYSWPLLSSMLLAAASANDSFNVIDFGGSLGTTFFQNKKFFNLIPKKVHYGVVEQFHYVQAGNKFISNENLKFYHSIEEFVCKVGSPDLVLFSGVLQYLRDPMKVLAAALLLDPPYILLDRTPFVRNGPEKIMVQVVPEAIYPARYPHRFFDKKKLLEFFGANNYALMELFGAIDGSNSLAEWQGGLFVSNAHRECFEVDSSSIFV